MQINYLDYSEDIFRIAIKNRPAKIYVFNNYNNKQQAAEIYQQPVLKKRSVFLTLSELKENIFTTNKIVLKEEKLSVILYELLTAEEKKILSVDDYFDVIDLAGDFFRFYDELNEYNIDEIVELKEWQEQKYKIFQQLRQRYIEYMRENEYSDLTLNFSMENFTPQYLDNYEEIVFVNVVNFTPAEKQMLYKIEDNGQIVSLYLQLSPRDFDEKALKLRSITLPAQPETQIAIEYTGEELLQLVNMLASSEGEECCILDANYCQSNYQKLLSPAEIEMNREIDYTYTSIFKFINYHYQLLQNAENTGSRLKLKMEDLIKFCLWKKFRNYYQISKEEYEKLLKLAADDYVYFDKSLAEQGMENILLLLEEIEKISKFKSLFDFCNYLENINLELLNDREYKNNIVQYFDALSELKTLAEMDLNSSWSKYFKNTALGLFRIVINYLKYKNVTRISEEKKRNIKIEDLSCAAHLQRKKIVILNANNDLLPSLPAGDFLLSESQRGKLGLPLNRERRREQKYNFFRHLFSSKQAVICYLDNLEKDKTASPFVEELQLKYGIEGTEIKMNEGNYPKVMKSIFSTAGKLSSNINNVTPENRNKDVLKIESNDFPKQGFPLSYYKYRGLKECYYHFYLEHIAGLEEKWIKFENKLSSKVLGNIVHEMFEEIIGELRADNTKKNFDIDPDLITEVVKRKVAKYELKIPAYYINYYKKIIIDHILQSIIQFFKKIQREVPDEVEKILTEWSPQVFSDFFKHEKSNFYLTGRIDFIIESENDKHIIDFKTGGRDPRQLDFYCLLLKQSKEDNQRIKKYFYSVMEQLLLPIFSDPQKLQHKLIEDLENFIDSDIYVAEYKSRCKNCVYSDICRVVIR